VSAEFFPPRSEAEEGAAMAAAEGLAAFSPHFFSVTYGAGGGTREKTAEVAQALQTRFGVPAAAHITCVGQDKATLLRVASEHRDAGVRRLVALRGDMPGMAGPFVPHPEGFRHSVELVAALKELYPFDISVAAFPEVHPEALSEESDIAFLRDKLDAGAERAITQFCFDTDKILRFIDKCLAAGVDKPIVPGIMPIRDLAGVKRFAGKCGASVPAWIGEAFAGRENDAAVAASIAAAQCRALYERGVSQFHFYCMNRADPTLSVWREILG